jgi:transcriptional regulator with XRE-family HTH domain
MSTKNKKSIKKVGRPKFVVTKEMCDKAEAYAAQGLTQEQIAMALGIGLSTLYEKQNEFIEFAEAIKRGKGKGIQTITNRLYEKALEGDNTAMIFYLKNRAGWQDKIEKETIIEQRQVIDLSRISDDELRNLERVLIQSYSSSSEGGNEKVIEGVHKEILASD